MALTSVLPDTSFFPVSHQSTGTPHSTVIHDWKEWTIWGHSHKVPNISSLLKKKNKKWCLLFLVPFHNCRGL